MKPEIFTRISFAIPVPIVIGRPRNVNTHATAAKEVSMEEISTL
jgi:hypothetical protein